MSALRAPGEPGRYMPLMDHICGFDGGTNDSPVCGKPATVHLFAGSPADGPQDWTLMACAGHFGQAQALAWDYHPISAVCDVPDSIWHAKMTQGEGFCYWPVAEEAMHAEVSTDTEVKI